MDKHINGFYRVEIEEGEIISAYKINLQNEFSIEIDWGNFIKMLMSDKNKRLELQNCIEYALNKNYEIRGEGAADVVEFGVAFNNVIKKIYYENISIFKSQHRQADFRTTRTNRVRMVKN